MPYLVRADKDKGEWFVRLIHWSGESVKAQGFQVNIHTNPASKIFDFPKINV